MREIKRSCVSILREKFSQSNCQARTRLKDSLLLTLVRKVGFRLHTSEDTNPVWFGHRVTIVDGSTLIMATTPEPENRMWFSNRSHCRSFPLICYALFMVLNVAGFKIQDSSFKLILR